jgi:large conductance mechanosensitive channel
MGSSPTACDGLSSVNGSQIKIGSFITALVAFVILAAVIFFFVIKPVNWLMSHRKKELPPDPTTHDCPYCFSSIPIQATRCPYCTSEVSPVVVAAS